MKNVLVETFGKEKRWVNWRLETRKGKTTKLPYSINGKLASSTDPKTWATYAEASKKSENVGIVFTPAKDLLGIDIDHCLDGIEIKHAQKKAIKALLAAADTYAEISPSKTGLHLFFKLSAPLKLQANRHENFECYTEGRYFTVTNYPYGAIKDVRTITPQEATELLGILGYPWKKEQAPPTTKNIETNPTTGLMSDKEVLERMFASTNGKDVKALYDGNISAYGDDTSKADMALVSHLAFWCGKDHAQMERLWLSSTLGSREKTKEREDYRTRTINAAIDRCTEVFTPGWAKPEVRKLNLLTVGEGKNKVVVLNMENIARVLRGHEDFKGKLRFDAFKNMVELDLDGNGWRELEDNDPVKLQAKISILFPAFIKVTKVMVWDALVMVAKENTIDSAADYLKSLKWDGTNRLETWLHDTYGTQNDVYHRAVGSNWLKGMVKRLVEPGCKFDYVLVLEGKQDLKKSMSLNVLVGREWYVETTMSTDSKDFFMQFLGKALIEFSEGETLSRTETKRMKAIITMQSDRYRPSYGRASVDFPRRCVFAMTTNQEEYLKDETGNRRWLPVAVEQVANVEWLAENREQLFAEAYHRVVELKETTWDFPKEETLAAQDARRIHDPNEESVITWYTTRLTSSQRENGITILEAHQSALNSGFGGKMSRSDEMSMADMFKRVLKLERKRAMMSGVQANRWFPTPLTPTAELAAQIAASAF